MCVFQGEDGIRDLVRSRGLGDVYKRQHISRADAWLNLGDLKKAQRDCDRAIELAPDSIEAVSYTHLTLPTSDLV